MLKSILLCGVGGQGVLLAAKLIANAAGRTGFDVFTNEIHGMAQRGGSVTASVRFGDKVVSPLIPEGGADALFAMEHAESLRCAHFLKEDGVAVIARESVIPVTVTTGAAHYPSDISKRIEQVFPHRDYVDCGAMARKLGNARLSNTILLGILSKHLPEIPISSWLEAMREQFKPEIFEINYKAFTTGRES